MRELEREPARLAAPAGSLARIAGLAKEKLSQPERQSLLSHSAWPVKKEARRQRPSPDRLAQPLSKRFVTVEGEKGHGGSGSRKQKAESRKQKAESRGSDMG